MDFLGRSLFEEMTREVESRVVGFVLTYTDQISQGESNYHDVLRAQGKGEDPINAFLIHFQRDPQANPSAWTSVFLDSKILFNAWSLQCPHSKEATLSLGCYKELSQERKANILELQPVWLCELMKCPHNRTWLIECLLTTLGHIDQIAFHTAGGGVLKIHVWIYSGKYAHSLNR